MTDNCNWCEEEITLPDDVDVISVVCPKCGNITGVCANCHWHGADTTVKNGMSEFKCDECPFKMEVPK